MFRKQDVGKLPVSTIKEKQAMSSQDLLFGMVPVYLTDSPQITNSVFAARRWATRSLGHRHLSWEFRKL